VNLEKIIVLLSNHRHPNHPALPTTLTQNQIASLLRSSLSPNESSDKLRSEVYQALRELQAQGEVLAGKGNRYCMAPPTVLAWEKDNLTTLLFRGDRAYLSLAHKALKTEQNQEEVNLQPQISGFNHLKNRLNQVGIGFLTVASSLESLPEPQALSQGDLRSPWNENPFTVTNWSNHNSIKKYVPNWDKSQKERWVSINYQQELSNGTLLQLPTGEYFWFQDDTFYELEPDKAIMTMFYQDKQKQRPLKIIWDKPTGKLNLQGIILPSAYARWLWQLSTPDEQTYRTRCLEPINHPFVEEAFRRLGSDLV